MPPTITSAVGRPWEITGRRSTVPPAQFKVETRLDAIAEYRQWLWQEIQSDKGAAVDALQQLKERAVPARRFTSPAVATRNPVMATSLKALSNISSSVIVKKNYSKSRSSGAASTNTHSTSSGTIGRPGTKTLSRAEQAHKDILDQVRRDDACSHTSLGLTRGEHAHVLIIAIRKYVFVACSARAESFGAWATDCAGAG